MATVQARVAVAKKLELVDGPDDADVVVTLGVADVGLDPAVAFMQGRMKATGNTGHLFSALVDGSIARSVAAAVATSAS